MVNEVTVQVNLTRINHMDGFLEILLGGWVKVSGNPDRRAGPKFILASGTLV